MAAPEMKRIFCRQCRGTLVAPLGKLPYGWLHLSVGVPEYMDPGERGYQWIGMFCGAECLAAAMPGIQTEEIMARLAYEAEVPTPSGGDA